MHNSRVRVSVLSGLCTRQLFWLMTWKPP